MKQKNPNLDNILAALDLTAAVGKSFWRAVLMLLRYLFGSALKVRVSEKQLAIFKEIDGALFLGTGNLVMLSGFKIKKEEKRVWGKSV